jgi:DNA polymerase-2
MKDNETVKRLEYAWSPSIYVASDLMSELLYLTEDKFIQSLISNYQFKHKCEEPAFTNENENENEVLKLFLKDSSNILKLARYIERLSETFGHYRLYNVDITPEQSFMYEKEIYTLQSLNLKENADGGLDKHYSFQLSKDDEDDDNIDSFNYIIPSFKFLSFDIVSEQKTIANDFSDKILKIAILVFDKHDSIIEQFSISEVSEFETILAFCYEVTRLDPDIIITKGGDQFLFPHLFYRAKTNGIEIQLLSSLNREQNQEYLLKKNKSLMDRIKTLNTVGAHDSSAATSYVSYGKVYFKPRPFYLYGRIHIDLHNCFIYKDNGLDGLVEISRICRIPLQLSSRATIGKCLSSLYFYNAYKNDILIPWKPTTSEIPKSFFDLLKADKGGTVFESKPGAYDKIAEFDFVSLYPNIMLKKNVSSDTINCQCCKDDLDNKVPGLEHLYHLCKKRTGIVPLSLKIVLSRRIEYKRRMKDLTNSIGSNNSEKLKTCYNNRQSALKWILVTSFGYLGFSNSKFGRIDAHIAVCAFARYILLKTSKIAEKLGYKIIHGIVDSIWVKETGVENCTNPKVKGEINYRDLKKEIEERTGFSVSFEGVYNWIVFDSSKTNSDLPALNRYFGVFKDGTIKMRGIETRRHDTPKLFVNFQQELMETMANCENITEILNRLSILEKIFQKYAGLLSSNKISYTDLIFTKRISKNSNDYENRNTVENCVLKILSKEGKSLSAGEQIKFIITDYYNKNSAIRAIPIELVEETNFKYDEKRYLELLRGVYDSITKVFYKFEDMAFD